MTRLEGAQPLLVLAAVGLGTTLSGLDAARSGGDLLLVPLLMALLLAVFLQLEPGSASRVLRDRRVLTASLLLNFVVAPALAVGLGRLLLDAPSLRIGLLLLLVTPCTDWYLAFTATARGDLAIATGLLPVNLALQLTLLPVYLVLLGGGLVPVGLASVAGSLVLVAGLPLAIALAVRWWAPPRLASGLGERLSAVTVWLLVAAVVAMFAGQGQGVVERPGVLVALVGPLLAFFAITYVVAQVVAGRLSLPHAQRVTLTMTVMARNSPLALALAVTAFAQRPMIALALVAAPLVELPVLALAATALRRRASARGPASGR